MTFGLNCAIATGEIYNGGERHVKTLQPHDDHMTYRGVRGWGLTGIRALHVVVPY